MKPINIVIPMAGRGTRFAQMGYVLPKPLISVHGVPMIRLVIENVRPKCPHRFIFVCQRDHVERFDLAALLAAWAPGSSLVQLRGVTEGAACTVLLARDEIDFDAPLMIVNSDQYVDASIDKYLSTLYQSDTDGLIMTMTAHDPKWSFVDLKTDGTVLRVVEKQAISDRATVGIYNFSRAVDFFTASEDMINRNLRVNGEFYVAPVYNILIERGYRVATYNVGREGAGMYGLGTPADLEKFLALPLARRVTAGLVP